MLASNVTALAEVRARKFGPPIPLAVNSARVTEKIINILLVEDSFADSILVQKELSHAFRDGGYHLQGVRTQSQALTLLDEREFDVVLLDLNLPDSSGLETLMRLQMDFPHLPVIVLTGYEDETFALEAVGNGAQDYLVKSKVTGQTIKRVLQYALQRKRLELDLREARQQAEKANRAKSEFLTAMSHELRTPLNAISGFTQMMLIGSERNLSARERGYLGSVLTASDHLLTLVNDILELAKIDARKINIKTETVDVGHLLSELEHYLVPLARQKNLKIKIMGEKTSYVAGDYTRLLQVLLNLASNAVKYNRDHGQIEVRAEKFRGQVARITITDTGFGIPESRQTELFQPFNRLGAENGTIPGTGVGLTICHNLMYEMNGVIDFKSTEGEGSSFWIEMPLADAPAQAADITPEVSQSCIVGKPRILYVEDNDMNRNLIRDVLENLLSAEVTIADTVADGIISAKTYAPDLIIADIHFSKMTGFDLLQQLQADPRTHDIPVFALTADATDATLEKIKAAGFQQAFTKPFNVKDMVNAIHTVLVAAPANDINFET